MKRYVGFVDPSGGSSDSMTLAVAHADAKKIVLDGVWERRPPFSPEVVVEEFADTLKRYGLSRVTGDRYAGEWPRERFRVHGITYQLSERTKSEIYGSFLILANSGQVEIPLQRRLIAQLQRLERRVTRGSGRESVDHAPGGKDDLSNAAAGALVLASEGASKRKEPLITVMRFPIGGGRSDSRGDLYDPTNDFGFTRSPRRPSFGGGR